MQINPNEELEINFSGDFDTTLSTKIQSAWFAALAREHRLPDWIKWMDGMSGKKYRYFINNLIASIEDARYLEIGSWRGSTLCSAMWMNKLSAIAIDNWSQFGGPKEDFIKNVEAAMNPDISLAVIDRDYRTVPYSEFHDVNVYLYDGNHDEEDQYLGLTMVSPALADRFILIVDDWNGPGVRSGTQRAIADLGWEIVSKIEILTEHTDTHPQIYGAASDWHNGSLICEINKCP